MFANLPLNQLRMTRHLVNIKGDLGYLSGMKIVNKKGEIECLTVALTFTWVYKIGLYQNQIRELRIKNTEEKSSLYSDIG